MKDNINKIKKVSQKQHIDLEKLITTWIDSNKVKSIIDQIDWGVLTHTSITDPELYNIMRINLEWVIVNLINDGSITIN